MTTRELRQGDVVVVEFPYTDRPDRERRPAVVVSAYPLGSRWPLVWVVMITSAVRERWNGDVEIVNFAAAGLRTPCVARTAKITNVELSSVRLVGTLEPETTARIMDEIHRALSYEPSRPSAKATS